MKCSDTIVSMKNHIVYQTQNGDKQISNGYVSVSDYDIAGTGPLIPWYRTSDPMQEESVHSLPKVVGFLGVLRVPAQRNVDRVSTIKN